MSDRLHGLLDAVAAAVLCCALGFIAGYTVGNPPHRAPAPEPITRPIPAPAPVHHTGHLYLSYIEPRYGSPSSAAVRDALAAVDWHALDCTFRAYTEGQDELKTLGFVSHFAAADLPVCFIQESGPKGAPIIDTAKGPTSAAAVLTRIKELRGN